MARDHLQPSEHGGDDSIGVTLPLSAFLTVWTLLALNILAPGPNVLFTITAAMGSGRAAGTAAAVAVGAGVGAWCLAMSFGMAAAFRLAPGSVGALTLAAAGVLIWFAVRYARAGLAGPDDAGLRGVVGLSARTSFLGSLSVNATNPKALTTWIAISGIFPTAVAAVGDIAVLTAGAALIAAGIHLCYAIAFSTPAAARFYLRAAPIVLLAVAAFFALFAIRLAVAALLGEG